MRKEHSHEYYWVLIFAAALGMYLLRVLLIAGEGKAEPDQETRTAKDADLEHGTSSQPYPQTGTYRYWFQYASERTPEVVYVKRPPVYVLREMETVFAELSDELPV